MSYTNGLDKPTDYFNTVLYTGDGTSSKAITGVGFQPDWVWIKGRSVAKVHLLHDIVRGQSGGEYYYLRSDSTNAESVIGDGSGLLSLDTDGFTVGEVGNATWNDDTVTYASWNWLAGGTASSNTDGSITSTVSASTTSGFSIVTYTGTGSTATIGHGLGSAPKMIFVKKRSGVDFWRIYSEAIGNTKYLVLNNSDATSTNTTEWNDTSPTSSVFTVGSSGNVNASGATFVAYCFAPKKGFSAMGQYTGNGNSDGTFVYTGFKPAFIMVKDYTGVGNNWFIWDNKRDGYNVVNRYVRPNLSDAEGYYEAIDILSNGFKNRNTSGSANGSGTGYIYMAFAENPFVTSTGIPTTAR